MYENLYPRELISFDFMPEQIQKARKNYPYADYYVGDITEIKESDERFDAIFVFGRLHHVPEWKKAIKELYRVLKKEGHLFLFEVNDNGVDFVDTYCHFHHPMEACFSWEEFRHRL